MILPDICQISTYRIGIKAVAAKLPIPVHQYRNEVVELLRQLRVTIDIHIPDFDIKSILKLGNIAEHLIAEMATRPAEYG